MKKVANETRIGVEPADLSSALASHRGALAAWQDLTPVGRRDYISWINEAKLPETRKRRIERCCDSVMKGKRRPCCFAVVPMDFYKALGEDPQAKANWAKVSSDDRRDLTDWIESAQDKAGRKERVKLACTTLSKGEPVSSLPTEKSES